MPSLFSEYSLLQLEEMGSLPTVTIPPPKTSLIPRHLQRVDRWLRSESSGQFGACRPAYCTSSLAVGNTGPPILLFFRGGSP